MLGAFLIFDIIGDNAEAPNAPDVMIGCVGRYIDIRYHAKLFASAQHTLRDIFLNKL